jgi:hypothetical protein
MSVITLTPDQSEEVVVSLLQGLVKDMSETLDMHENGRSDMVVNIFTNDPVQEIVQIAELIDSAQVLLDWYT